jgi:dipeptide transport system permease protein
MSRTQGYLWYFARRAGTVAFALWSLGTLVFAMIKVIPGDEAQIAAGPDASAEQIDAVRERLGLDAPLVVQYLRFWVRLLHGDLGTSIITFQPVLRDLEKTLPSTIELVIVAMIINLSIAIPAALLAAAWRDGRLDGLMRVVAVLLGGMPAFWLALMLQYALSAKLGLLPISGQNSYGMEAPRWLGVPTLDAIMAGDIPSLLDALRHIVLPASVLATLYSTQIFRALRTSLLGVLDVDFITAVRAKGATERRVLLGHAFPNSVNPVLTLAGTQLGAMIGAAVLVETVFARRGIGTYMFNAVAQKDMYAVLGTVLFIGAIVCLINLVVDILQIVIDPRIRAAAFGRS